MEVNRRLVDCFHGLRRRSGFVWTFGTFHAGRKMGFLDVLSVFAWILGFFDTLVLGFMLGCHSPASFCVSFCLVVDYFPSLNAHLPTNSYLRRFRLTQPPHRLHPSKKNRLFRYPNHFSSPKTTVFLESKAV